LKGIEMNRIIYEKSERESTDCVQDSTHLVEFCGTDVRTVGESKVEQRPFAQ
jgi:hypothetical protein